jgi:MFS family permease
MVYNSFGDSSERESESLNAQNNESNTTLATYSTFTNSQKRLIVFLTAFTSLFSPLSSIIYYPVLTFIAQDLNVSLEMMNLTITSYLVISGIAPALLGDLANTLGRRSIYIGMMMVYVAANIALASQHSYIALVILRMVQSFGSSGEKIKSLLLFNSFLHSEPRANEVSNDCDCVWHCWRYCESSRKRLIYRVRVLRVYFQLRYRGPGLGGAITQHLGWRSIFWFLAILSGFCFTLLLLLFPETSRNIVGNGNVATSGLNRTLLSFLSSNKSPSVNNATLSKRERKISLPNPLTSFYTILKKDAALIMLTHGTLYTTYSCIQASLSLLFIEIYHFSVVQAGSIYLPCGVGLFWLLISPVCFLSQQLRSHTYCS